VKIEENKEDIINLKEDSDEIEEGEPWKDFGLTKHEYYN